MILNPKITFIYSYYKNKGMFLKQLETWQSYTKKTKRLIEIIVTDDCSPDKYALRHLIKEIDYPNIRLFQIKEKVPWNWLECRNIGAKYAGAPWFLMTDMDHLVTSKVANSLVKRVSSLHPGTVYQLLRKKADGSFKRFHDDSYFIHKKLFWGCGGYDEHFSGMYGTSGAFRRRLLAYANQKRDKIKLHLILYGREVIPDASTSPKDMKRKEGRDPMEMKKREYTKPEKEVHFKYPYEEIKIEK